MTRILLAAWFRLVGLAAKCRGCDDPSFHTAHLRRGALHYLGSLR